MPPLKHSTFVVAFGAELLEGPEAVPGRRQPLPARRALIAKTLIANALNDGRAGCIGLKSRQCRCSSHKRFGALAISE